jgi:hypothetical protein
VALAQDAVRMASAAGNQLIEVAALAAYCDAIAGPDYVRERMAAANRMLSLATDLPDASLQRQASALLAHRLLLVTLLEQGDLPGAEQQATAYEQGGPQARHSPVRLAARDLAGDARAAGRRPGRRAGARGCR